MKWPRIGLDGLAVVALAAAAVILHRDGLFGGSAFYERDTQLFYYPLATWVGEQLRAGRYPLWLPGIFTGYPIFADGELGLLYLPQVLLLWWLPTATAMVWLRTLHAFLAGLFMHLFLRTLRIGPIAALGGALTFAFGSFLAAQMHHENVVRSAVWMPLVLALAERALRVEGGRRWAWVALAAVALAQAALGLHVQPVMMLALALAGYVAFRVASPWDADRRAGRETLWAGIGARAWTWALVLGGIGLGAVALAAAQLVPLAEWALVSFRRGGVDYEFASAFGLAGQNLPTLLFPYFFRLPDDTTWWALWQQWEIELYVGVPTLALALVGALFSRRREAVFFLVLGVLALWLSMSHYAPLFNLHQLLWSIPGFSFLRAPGRFTYLVVFAFAGLAALGLQALEDRKAWLNRLAAALVGAVPTVGLLAALLALFPAWRAWLAADSERGLAAVQAGYLSARAQETMDPRLPYAGLLASLDLANPKTAWSLALLGATAMLFVAWLWLGPRRARLGQALFVTTLAIDLLVFASDFHPRVPLASLEPAQPVGIPAGARTILRGERSLSAVEPNQLLTAGIGTVEGYSSLPSQRHVDLYAQTQQRPDLLELWSAPYVFEPSDPADWRELAGVQLRLGHPLVAGSRDGATAAFRAPVELGPIQAVRIVGTLSYAFEVPQGTQVAEVRVWQDNGTAVVHSLRAGVDLAERAIDRPSIRPLLRHSQPAGATLDFDESSPLGEDYQAHLYLSEWRLDQPATLRSNAADEPAIEVRLTQPGALVQIHGIGLVGLDGRVWSVRFSDGEGRRVVGAGPAYDVVEDRRTAPRAFVRDRALAVYRWTRPDETPVQIMSGDSFDPRRNVLIEGDQLPSEAGPPAADRPAQVADLGPNELLVVAEAERPSYLVVDDFFHRGWLAWVDGRPAPVSIANAVFRAVPLEPGRHVVELRFQPLSHLAGAVVSIAAFLAALVVVVWGFTRPTRPG